MLAAQAGVARVVAAFDRLGLLGGQHQALAELRVALQAGDGGVGPDAGQVGLAEGVARAPCQVAAAGAVPTRATAIAVASTSARMIIAGPPKQTGSSSSVGLRIRRLQPEEGVTEPSSSRERREGRRRREAGLLLGACGAVLDLVEVGLDLGHGAGGDAP